MLSHGYIHIESLGIKRVRAQAYCPNRSGHSNGAPRLHAYNACETQLLITRIQNATCDLPIRIGWPSLESSEP